MVNNSFNFSSHIGSFFLGWGILSLGIKSKLNIVDERIYLINSWLIIIFSIILIILTIT